MQSSTASRLQNNLMFRLGAAYRKMLQRCNEAFDETGLMAPHCLLLISLQEEEGVNQRTLARKLCLDASTITILLGRLEALDLVDRVPDVNDRRAKRAFLTDKGKETLVVINRQMNEVDETIRDFFPDEEEYETLIDALGRLVDELT